jgi:membrane-anchored protein YejM (alkaline phosphatase superfamily)
VRVGIPQREGFLTEIPYNSNKRRITMDFMSFLVLLIISIVVFGKWWEGLNYEEVYIVPAILGCLFLVVFAVDLVKTTSKGKK